MGGSEKARRGIYNIPAGADFSRVLAGILLEETREQPEALTGYKILLPTRRACRVMRDSFLDLSDGRPVLLPQMNPIGDVDEEDLSLLMLGEKNAELDTLPAMPSLRRQIILARTIMKIPDFAQGFDHALVLAQALAQLIDKTATEELSLSDLQKIVPHEFAGHWQITLKFLEIISVQWPHILSESGYCDAASRRNILLHALARHWEGSPPATPVIVAGSTGSLPATGNLISVIAGLPQGRVYLPGLDTHIDAQSRDYIEESHPQYGLKMLLKRLGVAPEDVQTVGESFSARAMLAGEMMRPAQTTDQWRSFSKTNDLAPMLEGLRYYECKTQQEEAQLIALLIRIGLEEKGRTIALISPDRDLATRVTALCRSRGIDADDSAGQNLSRSRIGKYLALSVGTVVNGFDTVALCAFLKHTLCHAGMENSLYRKRVRDLEKDVLRARKPVFQFERMKYDCQKHSSELSEFCGKIEQGLSEFFELGYGNKSLPFTQFVKAHLKAAEFFATGDNQAGEDMLWRGDDGEAAALFFADLMRHGAEIGDVTIREYEKILQQLLAQVSIRTPYGVHPRLAVLGQLEARLTSADLIIMAGLNEGSWPSSETHDPWMSRKMRKDFGLPTEEKSIGLAAHDFVQGFCAQNVVITRALQKDGAPCVASRWLQRLDTVLGSAGKSLRDLSGDSLLHWVRTADQAKIVKPYDRPKPCPPLSARPRKVSVTKIEHWMRDPYGIYAYYTLRLRPLDALSREMDVTLGGTVLHETFDRFTAQNPIDIPEHAMQEMIGIAGDVLKENGVSDEDLSFWWSRFIRSAEWFIGHEKLWRQDAKFHGSELLGKVHFDVSGHDFTIEGRADRIDRRHGGYAIIDYKTGSQFSVSKLRKGELPQLPLEALMAARGGFENVQSAPVSYLGYWLVTGGREPGKEVSVSGEEADEAVRIAEEGVLSLLRGFFMPETAFICIPDMNNAPKYNDFEHLSRLKEWAVLDDASVVTEDAE